MSLVDEAKKLKSNKRKNTNKTVEEIELALAWLKGEVNLMQIARVTNKSQNGSYSYCFLVNALGEAFKKNKLKIV